MSRRGKKCTQGARAHVQPWFSCRIHVPTSRLVAIKIINLDDSNDDIAEIQLEISHLAACDSPWVTRYYGSFLRGWKLWIGEPAEQFSCCIEAGSVPLWRATWYAATSAHTAYIAVMEYLAGGSCLDLVSDSSGSISRCSRLTQVATQLKPGPWSEAQIAIVCRELLLGLEYLHGENKIHRDIKGE